MKTSVEINGSKVKLAKQLGRVETLRELIDAALDAYINQTRRQSMLEILGTPFFDGNLKAMRRERERARR